MSGFGSDSPRRRRQSHRHHTPAESAWTARLTQLTDAGLLLTLATVTLCFGGRTPIGQLVLVVMTTATTLIWCVRQMTADDAGWRPTRTLWLWGLCALIPIIQAVPLSAGWLQTISPEHHRLLSSWSSSDSGVFPAWTTLSLAPAETTSGLATFLCYALIFLVAYQRLAVVADAERLLRGIVAIGFGVAVFAILQFLLSNGRFYWFYEHPVVKTNHYANGPFTNRNHLAQFLALMIGPSIWWLSCAASADKPVRMNSFGPQHTSGRSVQTALIALGLTAVLLAICLSLSRGGLAAMAVAAIVGLALLARQGNLPAGVLPIAFGIAILVGAGALATNYDTLAKRVDGIKLGKREVIWAANVRVAARFPWFGTGIGTHAAAHQMETDMIDDDLEFSHAESGYLQVASECGTAGVACMVLTILACLRWCGKTLHAGAGREIDRLAAAISASFAANLLHAGVDFVWYVPGCMVVIALLAAAIARLSALANPAAAPAVAARSRPLWGGGVLGIAVLAAWMISLKLPGALAEPHHTAYQRMIHSNNDFADEDEGPQEIEREKMAKLIRAARLDPTNSRGQLAVSTGYLRLFHAKQATADNPLTLDQLRDAAMASEFDSAKSLHEWLTVAVGPNLKYLLAARHYSRKAVENCPLEGLGYLILARLDFLRDPSADYSEPLQQQALAVQPFDAAIDFEIGKLAAQQGDMDRAMTYWQQAFRRSPDFRREIAYGLAGQLSAAEFLDHFQPDREGLRLVLRAYEQMSLTEELPLLRHRYVQACIADVRALPSAETEPIWLETVRTLKSADQPEAAIQIATKALETHSQSMGLHKLMAELLIEQQDYEQAARHLKWAAARAPNDANLQRLADMTTRQALRNDGVQRQ